jgi:hypothetical protein
LTARRQSAARLAEYRIHRTEACRLRRAAIFEKFMRGANDLELSTEFCLPRQLIRSIIVSAWPLIYTAISKRKATRRIKEIYSIPDEDCDLWECGRPGNEQARARARASHEKARLNIVQERLARAENIYMARGAK